MYMGDFDLTDIKRGTTNSILFTFKDADLVAIDISGYTIILTVKCEDDYDITDSKAVIQKTELAPSDATSQAGEITFTLDPDDTRIDKGNYLYDCKLIDLASNEQIPIQFPASFILDGTATNKGA